MEALRTVPQGSPAVEAAQTHDTDAIASLEVPPEVLKSGANLFAVSGGRHPR